MTILSISTYANWREKKTLEQASALIHNQIELARTLNITRGETIYLCASTDAQTCACDWRGPIVLFTSDAPPKIDTLLNSVTLPDTIHIKVGHFNKGCYLRFMSSGELVYNGTFILESAQQSLTLTVGSNGLIKEGYVEIKR